MRIIPCHGSISLLSPVASFLIEVPRSRVFEVACATDPRLFLPERRRERTPDNFFTSRRDGWMRARSGATTYVLPKDALLRLLSGKRIHYVLGAFGGAPMSAMFTTPPAAFDRAPFVAVADARAKRILAARRFGGPIPKASVLAWGGDFVLRGRRARAFGSDDFDRDMDIGWEDEQPAAPSTSPSAKLVPSHVVSVEIRDASGAVSKLSHEYPVEPGGAFKLPPLPPFAVEGVLLVDLRQAIHDALIRARVFPRATVNVALSQNLVPYGVKLSPNDPLVLRILDREGNPLPASGSYRLDATGHVDLPIAGRIEAAGKTLEEIQRLIIEALARAGAPATIAVHVSATPLA